MSADQVSALSTHAEPIKVKNEHETNAVEITETKGEDGMGNWTEDGRGMTIEEMREEKKGFLAYVKTRDFWILLVAGYAFFS